MSQQERFVNEWKRLLKISPRAADVFRREHNRRVLWEHLTFGDYREWTSSDSYISYTGEEVVRMENGRATAVRSRISE